MQAIAGPARNCPAEVACCNSSLCVVKLTLEMIANVFEKIQPFDEDRIQSCAIQTRV